jgi:putative ABC transport system permease protein
MPGPLTLLTLAARSLWNRKVAVLLSGLAVALSVGLYASVDKLRKGAAAGFESTLHGADLIVGARTGPINLLMYAIFRIGDATQNVSWDSYQRIAAQPGVAWTIPLALGDSYRGYRVVGTTPTYFEHYQYGAGRSLAFADGAPFEGVFDAVLGAEVARALGHRVGDKISLTHGIGQSDFGDHADRPFTVVGVLAPTGTPVDRSVHVSLAGVEAIHVGWESGAPSRAARAMAVEDVLARDLTPTSITAFIVGMSNRANALHLGRAVNTFRGEALMAINPALTLRQMRDVVGLAENTLAAITLFVVGVGLVTILIVLLTSLNARRREMAVLRAIGLGGGGIFALLVLEAVLVGVIGAAVGLGLTQAGLALLEPVLEGQYGLVLEGLGLGWRDVAVVGTVGALAGLLALLPAWQAWRGAVADGLSVRA